MAILTISREYGSGGREIGRLVAGQLGYAYEDRVTLLAALLRGALDEELDGDPADEQPAEQLDIGRAQQLRHEEGRDDPQQHRGPGAEQDAAAALLARERPHRHRDDDRVVAGEDQVDQDDARERRKEGRVQGDAAEHSQVQILPPSLADPSVSCRARLSTAGARRTLAAMDALDRARPLPRRERPGRAGDSRRP